MKFRSIFSHTLTAYLPAVLLSLCLAAAPLPGQADAGGPGGGSVTVRENIFDSQVLSSTVQIMVGDRGKIFRSTDQGQHWTAMQSGYREPLFSVCFTDDSNGWVSGTAGAILHTTDGGVTWSRQATGTDKHLFSIHFADARNGVAVGDWGTVLRSSDGGETWQDASMEEDIVLYGVRMRDAATGWIAGEFGQIFETDDGGATWRRILDMGKSFFCLSLDDRENVLYAAGLDGRIAYSTDLGEHWQLAESGTAASIYGIAVAGSYGIAVGDNGTVLQTSDGGRHWSAAALSFEAAHGWLSAASIKVNSDPVGRIAGANGVTLAIDINVFQR